MNLTEAFNKDYEAALADVHASRKFNKSRLRDFEKAPSSKYHFLAVVAPHWIKAFDSNFTDTKLHALLIAAHDVPLFNSALRHNANDYWAETRWLVDAVIRSWAEQPSEMTEINQSHLHSTLDYISKWNNSHSELPILRPDEARLLHSSATELRILGPAKIAARLNEFQDTRKQELSDAITQIHHTSHTPHKDYYRRYFGLN